jgi:uncharacterized metal-binding protein YceD (DUF177 family)
LEIAFKKIAKEGSDFALKQEKIDFFGRVSLLSQTMVSLKAKIEGEIEHNCDRCGEDIVLKLDESVEIIISDGIYKGETDVLDVVEIHDGLISFDDILQSEVEAYKSDYHYCDRCNNSQ